MVWISATIVHLYCFSINRWFLMISTSKWMFIRCYDYWFQEGSILFKNTRLNATALSIGESCKQLSLLFLVIIIQEYIGWTNWHDRTRNKKSIGCNQSAFSKLVTPDTILHYHSHVNTYISISFFDNTLVESFQSRTFIPISEWHSSLITSIRQLDRLYSQKNIKSTFNQENDEIRYFWSHESLSTINRLNCWRYYMI